MKTRVTTNFLRVGRVVPNALYLGKEAFSLIEMIGVMAVMAILAAVTIPNVLQSIELATVRAEAKTLAELAPQIQRYTANNTTQLTAATWTAQISGYTDLSTTDLLRNKRGRDRVYLTDTTTNRAMILSVVSAKSALTLPAALSATNFQLVWDTVDNAIPNAVSWAGWANWNNVRNSEQCLVIQRINLGNELQSFTLTFNYPGSGVAPQYEVVPLGSSSGTRVTLTPVLPSQSVTARSKQMVKLYPSASATTPTFTYVVSNSVKTFVFNGTWSAQ